jgi:poly(hydroxyalkanoate) depolymerase family esterase
MRRLGPTVARLNALRRGLNVTPISGGGRLTAMTGFGGNPGALSAQANVPDDLAPGAALVVVLHGCTQQAEAYDRGSGWSTRAERDGFAVLYPEQGRGNNHNLCFNWYDPADARRGRGEAASIAQMIRHMIATHRIDPARVFINGLSAGGAMTAVMLACYPELFAGGAIIAGLPFEVAKGVPEALERMRGQGMPSRAALASRIRNASDHAGPWPTLSVWHGTADHVVSNANAGAIVDQWLDRIGLGDAAPIRGTFDGQARTTWRDSRGKVMVERIDIAGMGHGTPLATREGCGQAGPHMLEAGICSTSHLATTWQLTGKRTARPVARPADATASKPAAATATLATEMPIKPSAKPAPRHRPAAPRATGVGAVIEDALRAAGLMR